MMDVGDDPGGSRYEEKSKPINRKSYRSCFPPSSDSSSGSALSSPIGGSSELGSSSTEEAESDQEDDYIAELTRQMADHMLQEEEDDQKQHHFKTWDLGDSSQELENCDKIISSSGPSLSAADIEAKRALVDKAFHVYKLNKAEQQHNQQQKQPVTVRFPAKKVPWMPNLAEQTRNGSELRAVLLGGYAHHQSSGSKSNRRSSGTGVFLPPAPGIATSASSPESRKQSGRSTTVLVPERVVQSLRLHYMSLASSTGAAEAFPPQPAGGTGDMTYNVSLEMQVKSQRDTSTSPMTTLTSTAPAPAPAVDSHEELSLPQEWTY